MEAQVLSNELIFRTRAMRSTAQCLSNDRWFAWLVTAASSGTGLAGDQLGSVRPIRKKHFPPKCLLPNPSAKAMASVRWWLSTSIARKLLVVTLGITDVVERTGLTVSVWGSPDQNQWGSKPLAHFPPTPILRRLFGPPEYGHAPDVRYLRVQWSMNRWGRGERTPLFGFEVFLEESGARVSGSAVA
jgi:hypothetical protein